MALTDEMQNCNLTPITIKTKAKHTIPALHTRVIYASIPVSTDHSITGTIQPLPQFDECSKLMIAPAYNYLYFKEKRNDTFRDKLRKR